jgi:hypothetical protein
VDDRLWHAVHDSRGGDVTERPWSGAGGVEQQRNRAASSQSDERSKEAGASGHGTAATEKQRDRMTCGARPNLKFKTKSTRI